MRTWIQLLFFISAITFPESVSSQTIKGNVYLYDSGDPATAHLLLLINNESDTIRPTSLSGIPLDGIGDYNGNFELNDVSVNKNDLLINLLGYRNTVVKNIPLNADEIVIKNIPMFLDDSFFGYETVVEKKKILGIFVKRRYYSEPMGQEGPFSYADELTIECQDNSARSIHCVKGINGIEIDYEDLNACE